LLRLSVAKHSAPGQNVWALRARWWRDVSRCCSAGDRCVPHPGHGPGPPLNRCPSASIADRSRTSHALAPVICCVAVEAQTTGTSFRVSTAGRCGAVASEWQKGYRLQPGSHPATRLPPPAGLHVPANSSRPGWARVDRECRRSCHPLTSGHSSNALIHQSRNGARAFLHGRADMPEEETILVCSICARSVSSVVMSVASRRARQDRRDGRGSFWS
jgi:hypothetical protein